MPFFYVAMALMLFLDMFSKWWVHVNIPKMQSFFYPYGGIGVFRDFLGIEFTITHVTNKGAAWGILAEHSELLVFLRLFFIVFLLFEIKKSPFIMKKPLLLILTGAIGNLIDAFLYGHVIDMFRFVFFGWPFAVFNIADACVTVGITWLVIVTLFFHDSKREKAPST